MMRRALILAGLLAALLPRVADAQEPLHFVPGIVPVSPTFRTALTTSRATALSLEPAKRSRVSNAVFGGIIGAGVGLLTCTIVSNLLAGAETQGITTCTKRGNLMFAGGGFVLGATIGALWNK
jgi:hypothetical protein